MQTCAKRVKAYHAAAFPPSCLQRCRLSVWNLCFRMSLNDCMVDSGQVWKCLCSG